MPLKADLSNRVWTFNLSQQKGLELLFPVMSTLQKPSVEYCFSVDVFNHMSSKIGDLFWLIYLDQF